MTDAAAMPPPRKILEREDARYGLRVQKGKDGSLVLTWLPSGRVVPPHIASIDGDEKTGIVIRFREVEDL